jgi:hypothetical protein
MKRKAKLLVSGVFVLLLLSFARAGAQSFPDHLTSCSVSASGVNCTCYAQCNGQVVCVPSGGSPPYTYSWSPGNQNTASVLGVCAGTYTVTITDGTGCLASGQVTVNQPAQLSVSMSSSLASCGNCADGSGTALVNGGTPSYSYTWTPGPGTGSPNYSNIPPGTYTCCVSDSHNCQACQAVSVAFSTAVIENTNSKEFWISPNPFSASFEIHVAAKNLPGQLVFYNLLGEKISDQQIMSEQTVIDESAIHSGIYFLSYRSFDHVFFTRIIKE